jgi:hypothetical protein
MYSYNNKTRVIAVGCHSGVGKDTAGEYLTKHCGYVRVAFADYLKNKAMQMFNLTKEEVYVYKDVPLLRMQNKTPRSFLQQVGDEMRKAGTSYLILDNVKKLIEDLQSQGRDVVVTDLRLPEEVKMLKDNFNSTFWQVIRNTKNNDLHRTETALDNWNGWDNTIYNNGTRDQFLVQVQLKQSTM